MDLFTQLLLAVVGSAVIGSGIALFIQIGKLFAPKLFPDGSADNWRLGISLVVALFIFLAPTLGLQVDLAVIERFFVAFQALGGIIMPLIVWLSGVVAQSVYTQVLKGVKWIGKSWTPA